MDVKRIESMWRGGDRQAALALAQTAEGDDLLPVAEALLRCARDVDAPEWEDAARFAVRLREKVWPPGHPRAGYSAMPLADLLKREGRLADAEAVLRQSEALAEAGAGDDSDPLRDAVFARARLHLVQGRDDQAEAALLRAAEIEDAGRHPKRPPFTAPLGELRALYMRQGRYAEAAAMAERELKAGRLVPGDEAILLTEHARALLAAGQVAAAKKALARAQSLLSKPTTADPDPLVATIENLLSEASRGG